MTKEDFKKTVQEKLDKEKKFEKKNFILLGIIAELLYDIKNEINYVSIEEDTTK